MSTNLTAHPSLPSPEAIETNPLKVAQNRALSGPNPDYAPSTEGSGGNPLKVAQNRVFSDIDPNFRLSNTQSRAIELALDGLRWTHIASALNLNPKTLWRWKTQNPDFQHALACARDERFQFLAERCYSLAGRAMSVLTKFLEDPTDENRMRTAQLFLQAAARFQPPRSRHPQSNFRPEYPNDPLITPPPTDTWIEPDLEPKVG